MPIELYEFLRTLPDPVADKIWTFLDGDPDCVSDMIEFIAETHVELTEKVCNCGGASYLILKKWQSKKK